jgi:hypothetical protein
MARPNATVLEERIEGVEMTQLMFEHPAEILNALGMDPSRHRNLASIDANGTTLARMIDAKDLIDALNSSHFIFVEPLSMSTGARRRTAPDP